ncbi:MAG: GNAT family N-acetyltransferase [Pyrinomonadaceae bacterium]
MLMRLETERLILRTMSENDIEGVFEMRRDEDVMRFIREPVLSRKEAEDWINLISCRWAKDRIGFCSLIEKQSGKFAGWCGLWQLKESGEIEVGYAVAKEFWGKGYASESAEEFLEYGFNKLNLEKIVAVARPENTASRRVMEKIGMKYDGIGKYYDRELVHYSIERKEFLTQRREDAEARSFKI